MIKKLLKYFFLKYQKTKIKKELHCNFGNKVDFNDKTTFKGRNFISNNVSINNSLIGFATYVGSDSKLINCKIGSFCSIGAGVENIRGSHPTSHFVSTHPAFFSERKQAGFTFVDRNKFDENKLINNKYSNIIGNDVWIGSHVKILEGVSVGNGAIIAAGSIVTKDVAPYSIIGGNPAKLIRYRLQPEEIKFLSEISWWDKDYNWLLTHAENFDDIERFITQYTLEEGLNV